MKNFFHLFYQNNQARAFSFFACHKIEIMFLYDYSIKIEDPSY